MTRKNIFFLSFLFIGAFVAAGALLFFKSAQGNCGKGIFALKKCAEVSSIIAPQKEHAVSVPEKEAVAPSSVPHAAILEKFKGKDVETVSVSEKLIALTFDGGGNAEGAEDIIKILSANGIRATFFLTGNFIGKFPDIVRKITDSGNEIANHTATHKNFSEISHEEATAEMEGMERAAEALGAKLVPFFRFPYGAPTKEKIALANERGYVAVRWTVDSLGWQGRKDGRDASFVAARVIGKAKPGAIVLMHLGSASDGSTFDADALEQVIIALTQQGYRLVPLSELFTEAIKNTTP
ncbi:polysaccharide deacetylase family protein [Candidatus Azambacteria bacterium]|nr:polysaccharide deacetylase family protein [Candidatus Azambacteria bacterium]